MQMFANNLNLYAQYGDSVIIYSSRNISYIILMLSLIKLGVTYVPLERQTPIHMVQNLAKEINAKYKKQNQNGC